LNLGENKMAKNSSGKRPCAICRKWFPPDVRQKGRQKTCSTACRKELHRRQCEEWNKNNQSDSKNNYLAQKLEEAINQEKINSAIVVNSLQRQTKPALPLEVILAEYGIKTAIIIQYLVAQITAFCRPHISPNIPPCKRQTNRKEFQET